MLRIPFLDVIYPKHKNGTRSVPYFFVTLAIEQGEVIAHSDLKREIEQWSLLGLLPAHHNNRQSRMNA